MRNREFSRKEQSGTGCENRVGFLWKGCGNVFEAGDYIVYGSTGICQVMGVTTMNIDGIPKDRLYYILRPEGQRDGKIFTPVENGKLVMRRLMTQKEAEDLISEIPEIETLDISDDKLREEKYKECLRTCESLEMIRIIKTIYLRRKDCFAQGKKITATDERYLKQAEENLYSELSMLLGVPKSDMEEYIAARLNNV